MKKIAYQVKLSVPVNITQQGDYYVAVSPLLDVSTQGSTMEQTQKRFAEAAQIFIEELIEDGVLEEVLEEMGWTKLNHEWNPPMVAQVMQPLTVTMQ